MEKVSNLRAERGVGWRHKNEEKRVCVPAGDTSKHTTDIAQLSQQHVFSSWQGQNSSASFHSLQTDKQTNKNHFPYCPAALLSFKGARTYEGPRAVPRHRKPCSKGETPWGVPLSELPNPAACEPWYLAGLAKHQVIRIPLIRYSGVCRLVSGGSPWKSLENKRSDQWWRGGQTWEVLVNARLQKK